MAAKTPAKFILATKVGMSQMYTEKGDLVGVTLLQVSPNVVVQRKTKTTDGYEAVQLGTGAKKAKNINKSLKGHFKDHGTFRWTREFRVAEDNELAAGAKLEASVFAVGDTIRVSGLTKGKGFAGAVKRHGFRGSPASHGHHHVLRHVGSIGQRFPQHTLKGSRGPGRDGAERIAVRGLRVMAVEGAVLAVKGAVPGPNGALLEVISI
jgi:large subunit ribosomal protein L3